jgi:hypothetical protein
MDWIIHIAIGSLGGAGAAAFLLIARNRARSSRIYSGWKNYSLAFMAVLFLVIMFLLEVYIARRATNEIARVVQFPIVMLTYWTVFVRFRGD